jgi:hypothetical protein
MTQTIDTDLIALGERTDDELDALLQRYFKLHKIAGDTKRGPLHDAIIAILDEQSRRRGLWLEER